MEATWGALAKELKDQAGPEFCKGFWSPRYAEVVVASVDALANRPLAELWAVERFPTIKLVRGLAEASSFQAEQPCGLRGGQVYDFEGTRAVDDLKVWISMLCGKQEDDESPVFLRPLLLKASALSSRCRFRHWHLERSSQAAKPLYGLLSQVKGRQTWQAD